MQVSTLFVFIITIAFLAVIFVPLLLLYAVNISEFFKNREIKKIARRLGLIDKGSVKPSFKPENGPDGEVVYRAFDTVHKYCGNVTRIAIKDGECVMWCSVCECIIDDDDDDGDDDSIPPEDPIMPDTKKTLGKIFNKIRKQTA